MEVHLLPDCIDLVVCETNKAEELIVWDIKGDSFEVFDLLHPLGVGLGAGRVKGIHHYDCSFASLCPLSHNLAIDKARLDSSTKNPLGHQIMIRGELAVAVVALLGFLIEPAPPSVELALDGEALGKLIV